MSASIEIPFAVGAQVWSAELRHETKWEPCPDCLGTKVMHVRLGNGDEHTIECATCRRGYEGSQGIVSVSRYTAEPRKVTLRRLVNVTPEVEYTDAFEGANCYTLLPASRLFANREECEALCEEMRAKAEIEAENRHIANLSSKRKDTSWSVHYWRRKVSDLKKDLAAAEKRLNAIAALRAAEEPQ